MYELNRPLPRLLFSLFFGARSGARVQRWWLP